MTAAGAHRLLRLTALVSLVLLSAFALAAIKVIVTGESVECGCYGLLYKEPVGLATVARDLVL